MAKKTMNLGHLLKPEDSAEKKGFPQRGGDKPAAGKRDGEKRLTLALDGVTYKRLRYHAVESGKTHQDILEAALIEYLNKHST